MGSCGPTVHDEYTVNVERDVVALFVGAVVVNLNVEWPGRRGWAMWVMTWHCLSWLAVVGFAPIMHLLTCISCRGDRAT